MRGFFLILSVLWFAGCGGRSAVSSSQPGTAVVAKPSAPFQQEEERVAPLLLKPERVTPIEPYLMPEPLRERLNREQPGLIPVASSAFKVFNQHLRISSKESKMTFTGVLRIPGLPDENLKMECSFDKSKAPWFCTEMVPTDEGTASQRRLQAVVECSDTYRCDRVSLELFLVIGGKTQSQLFQSEKFSVRKAVSGDIEESEVEEAPWDSPPTEKTESAPSAGKSQKRVESETPLAETPKSPQSPAPEVEKPESEFEAEELSQKDLEELMEDPNSALEYTPPMLPPPPTSGRYTIPGIEKLRPQIGQGVVEQAIGRHNAGALERGQRLPDSGDGYEHRRNDNRSYGANLLVDLLKGASQQVKQAIPQASPLVIANISKQGGGRLCGSSGLCHASHQTGLDVDVVFPSTRRADNMWSACPTGLKGRRGGVCRPGASISPDFDEARFWTFAKHLTCAEGQPVLAMFVDAEIKKHMCRWVRLQGEDLGTPGSCAFKTLRAMKHAVGHYNHVHVRFRCPGNRRCQNAEVTLGRGTGC